MLHKSGIFFVLFSLSVSGFADCLPEQDGEITVDKGTSVIYTLAEAQAQYQNVYESGHRITQRVYWSATENAFVMKQSKASLKISPQFISSLTQHIETALSRGYADFLFYSDMGHAHLFMPDSGDTSTTNIETHLGENTLTFLYHTAELFVLRENFKGALTLDPWLQWRYYSRNFVAKNDSSDALAVVFAADAPYNTVRDLDNHSSVATVYMSASRSGCFPFRQNGATYFFDFTID